MDSTPAFASPISIPTSKNIQSPTLHRKPPSQSNPSTKLRSVMEKPQTTPSTSSVPPPKPRTKYKPQDHIRPSIKSMEPYTPILPYEVLAQRLGRHPTDIVKLDANENPYGPSPKVAEALASAQYLNIYPDPESRFLREALAEYAGIDMEYLMVGAGADELIDLIFRLMITPGSGEKVVNFPPTFGMYKFDADVNGAEVISLMRDDDFGIHVEKVEEVFERMWKMPPKIVFCTSPNNPDGSTISDECLRRLLGLPTLVVLDEAYFEFCNQNRIAWVKDYDNLIVLRTLSKWAGLAGMRVGYGAFPLGIIKHLWKMKQPYNVSVGSQIAATASVNDKEDLLGKVEKMKRQREIFYEEIKEVEYLNPYPSESNFVLCRVCNGRKAVDIKNQLADRGILIRYYSSAGLKDCVRFSMGTDTQMQKLYRALKEL